MGMNLLCSAGELSGDRLLAPLIPPLIQDGWFAHGLGGDESQGAGLQLIEHLNAVTAHGFLEAVGKLGPTVRTYRRLCRHLTKADGLLVVDYPEVNTRLLKRAHGAGIPTCYLAPPQAWAWRSRRAEALTRAAWVGCLFEFETRWFQERGVEADWVGHPLGRRPVLPAGPESHVALLPGSRVETVRRLLPIMLEASQTFAQRHKGGHFHFGLASTVRWDDVRSIVESFDVPLTIHEGAQEALAASSSAVVGAGTASLEAALSSRPIVTLGRLSRLSAFVVRRLVGTPWFSLPNLIMGRQIFPELIQEQCSPAAVCHEIEQLVHGEGSVRDWLEELRALTHRPDGHEVMSTQIRRAFVG